MSPLSRLILLLAISCIFTAQAGLCIATEMPRQIIVVVSASWSDADARLYRFENRSGKWRKVGETVRAVVGENGMGWGVGSPGASPGFPMKKEGDRKAPAGMYPLLTAMGYAAA